MTNDGRSPAASAAAPQGAKRLLDLRLALRIFRLTAPFAARRNLLFGLVAVRAIQLPALSGLIAWMIDGPIASGDAGKLAAAAALFAGLALSTQVVLHFRQRLALELGEAVVQTLRNTLFEHLHRLPMGYFHRTQVGQVISHLTSDIEVIRVGVQEVLFAGLALVGQMVVAGGLMFAFDAALAWMVLGLGPVLWLVNRHFHARLSRSVRAMRDSFARVTATVAEAVSGIRVTQSFVRQEENARRFRELVADHSRNNLAVARAQAQFLPLLDLSNQFLIALLLLVGGYRVLSPEPGLSLSNLVGFLFMANIFLAPISALGGLYNQALTTLAGGERLFGLLDTPPDWTEPIHVDPPLPLDGRVAFHRVSFGYEPRRLVLRDIDFAVEPGQTVALVGPTGSGKSTLVQLLAKLCLPTSGVLTIDGRDIRQVPGDWLRSQIGCVPQQNFLFVGSIANNVRMSRPEASDDEIAETFRQLGCLDVFQSLPDGLNTIVSQRGENLSLGQRQLVCFARAMLAQPRILILDEATSSVDSATEARIQQALEVLMEGRTSFIVAHRLSTIRRADLVLVLNEGRIVEQGRHDDLLATAGPYQQLYRRSCG